MPYRKKYTRRKKYKKSTYSIAKKALKKVNKLASQVEIKHYDLDFLGPFTLDDLGTRVNLNVGISQGLTDSDRVGDTVKMLSDRLKITLDLNQTEKALIRAILMYDKEGSIEVADDFLSNTGDANVINTPYLVDERHKYVILHDKIYSMSQGHLRERQITLSKKLNKKTQFEAGTTNISKGILRLWMFCNIDSTTVPRPQFYGWSRVRYADL